MSVLALTGCVNAQPDTAGGDGARSPHTDSSAAASSATPAGSPRRGITDADREAAQGIVAQMSDEELAGAVILATYSSTDPAEGANLVAANHLAGAIVMNYNLPDGAGAAEVAGSTSALTDAAGDRGWPALVGVDQEGGIVARVRDATLPFPSLMAGGAASDKDVVTQATALQGTELRELGFTIDFAPVADVTIGAKDSAINVRSPGSDQDNAADTVAAAVDGYLEAGILSAAKHFPGHGALTADSHEELPVSDQSLRELADDSWEPFSAAARAHVPMIMVGHIALPDAKTLPASLNPDVYEALRTEVGFDDVAVTDALNMGAVVGQPGDPAVNAIKAGADLALMPPDAGASAQAMLEALQSGDLKRSRLEEAATRVVSMSLAQQRAAESGDVPALDELDAEATLEKYAQASLTVVKGACSYRPPAKSFRVIGGEADARATLARALEEHGLSEGAGGFTISLGARAGADVVVGTDAPWKVDRSGADTIITVYSGNEYALGAAAAYIAGEAESTAEVPVKVRTDAPDCSG